MSETSIGINLENATNNKQFDTNRLTHPVHEKLDVDQVKK